MGTRYYLDVECPSCGYVEKDCYYAPTCGFTTWKCPKCGLIINLEDYSGISYDEASNAGILSEAIDFLKIGISPEEVSAYVNKEVDEKSIHPKVKVKKAEV